MYFLQAEPFGKIISQLAEQEGVTEDKIMLSLSDINILGYDTPISVQLNVADIIGEYEINQYFCLQVIATVLLFIAWQGSSL